MKSRPRGVGEALAVIAALAEKTAKKHGIAAPPTGWVDMIIWALGLDAEETRGHMQRRLKKQVSPKDLYPASRVIDSEIRGILVSPLHAAARFGWMSGIQLAEEGNWSQTVTKPEKPALRVIEGGKHG